MKNISNVDIGTFIKSKKNTKIATKKTINLCTTEKTGSSGLKFGIGIAVLAVLVLLFAKFGVIDQIARANAAERALKEAQQKTKILETEAARFSDVRLEYLTYTSNWMGEVQDTSKEALVGVDRQDAIDLVDRVFSSKGTVTTIRIYSTIEKETKISRDILEVAVVTDSMKTASDILADVREEPLCEDADWHRSSTEDERSAVIGKVETVYTVYLKKPEEGEGK